MLSRTEMLFSPKHFCRNVQIDPLGPKLGSRWFSPVFFFSKDILLDDKFAVAYVIHANYNERFATKLHQHRQPDIY